MINVVRVVLLPAAVLLAACGGNGVKPTSIDEVRGTYEHVGIGATVDEVRRVFGEQRFSGDNEGIAPRGADFVEIGGATSIPSVCGPPSVLRYERVSFLFCNARVYTVIVAVEGAATRRGVAVGDPLDAARNRYRGLHCGDAPAGDALVGEHPTYPYCTGKIGGRHVWFGRDPIASITISTEPLRG